MLLDYKYRGRIATPSAAKAFACTPMTFLSSSYHVIDRGFPKSIAMTMPGDRSKSTGKVTRKPPRQDATQIHCVANGQRSLLTASGGAFGTELLHGAGTVLGGVEVKEVTLEKGEELFRLPTSIA